jgi:hypothetical protein
MGRQMQRDRAYLRVATSVPAKIVIDGKAPSRSCLVRNLSEGGACLQMTSTAGLPPAFTLVFETTTSRTCQVVWRTDTQLGVSFKPDPRATRKDSQVVVF